MVDAMSDLDFVSIGTVSIPQRGFGRLITMARKKYVDATEYQFPRGDLVVCTMKEAVDSKVYCINSPEGIW